MKLYGIIEPFVQFICLTPVRVIPWHADADVPAPAKAVEGSDDFLKVFIHPAYQMIRPVALV